MKDAPSYKVLARAYRPQRFSDVVGQEPIVTTLKNAIAMNRTSHAYLFCGPKGCGKTTVARLFAKAVNCQNVSPDLEPCNSCPSCKEITLSHSLDVLEIDGASHRGIEDIRRLNETIGFMPTHGKYKIFLIDEVHMLTKEAFNALLKTLEEPPAHVKFFFATTEAHKIPATILSRCQRFNLKRISHEKMVAKLKAISEDLKVITEDEALSKIAELSEGSLRDAESLFDQLLAFQNGKVTLEEISLLLGLPSKDLLFALDKAGSENRFLAAFEIANEIFSSGKNASYFVSELISHFRTLFFLKQNGLMPPDHKERYIKSSALYREEQLLDILEYLIEAQNSLKFAPSEKVAIEMVLLKILRSHKRISLENLVERLKSLEKNLSLSEDPVPKPEEIPPLKVKAKAEPEKPKPVLKKEPLRAEEVKKEEGKKLTIREQSRFDTLMHFAAKELNGSLKKES